MSTLRITTSVKDNNWVFEFGMDPGGDIPRDIFLWANTGEGIGEYQTICTLSEYNRFQTHNPNVNVPVFGNKYLKHTLGVITANIQQDPEVIRAKIVNDIKIFKASYLAGQTSTETVII